jgi:hypothetical protein
MPFHIGWYVEQQVIYARLEGDLTPEEYQACLRASAAMLQTVHEGQVHILNDVAQIRRMPNLFETIRSVPKTPQPQMGWMLTIGESNTLRRFWSDLFARIAPIRYRRFETVDQALEFLRQEDSHIDWTKANPDVLGASQSGAENPETTP